MRRLETYESRHENTAFAYAKTKVPISRAVTAHLFNAFVFATEIVQSLYILNTKFQDTKQPFHGIALVDHLTLFSSPEPQAHQVSSSYPHDPASVRPSSALFKALRNRLANESQISCGASVIRGNESLYKWSRSHDQDGRHAHKW